MKLQDMAIIVTNSLEAQLSDEIDIPRPALCAAIKALFDEIKTASKYHPVTIKGFGTFKTKTRKQRVICNALTKNQPKYVPETKVPAFSPAKDYKQVVTSPE